MAEEIKNEAVEEQMVEEPKPKAKTKRTRRKKVVEPEAVVETETTVEPEPEPEPVVEPEPEPEPVVEPEPEPEPVVEEPEAVENADEAPEPETVSEVPVIDSKVVSEEKANKYTGKVIASLLNVREKPEMNGAVLYAVNYNDKLVIVDEINGWGKLENGGFVMLKFIKKVDD